MKTSKNSAGSVEYVCDDINIASFLYASQITLVRLDPTDRSYFLCFIFNDSDRCKNLVKSYWQHTALIDAKTLFDGQRAVRDILRRRMRGLTSEAGL